MFSTTDESPSKKDRVAGAIPYYGASGILDHVQAHLFDEPLVLVGEDGAKWGAGERTSFLVEGKCWVNNHAHVLRPHCERIRDAWLVHYLNFTDLTEFVSGLTVPKLTQGALTAIPIVLPPVEEQDRILGIVSKATADVASIKRNVAQSVESATSLFDSYMQSVLSGLEDDWPLRKLGELCTIARGGSPRPIRKFLTSSRSGINWVKISDATASGKYIYSTEQRIDPSGAARSRMVHEGDFLLSNSMSFGRPYIMRTTGCIHDGWLVLRDSAQHLDQDYLYHVLGSNVVFEQFNRLAAGSTVRNLNIELASRVEIPVPPTSLQQQVANRMELVFENVCRLRSLYHRKLVALDALSQSLLHQAFTGAL